MKATKILENNYLLLDLEPDDNSSAYVTFSYEIGDDGFSHALKVEVSGLETEVSPDDAHRISRFMERFIYENRGSSKPEFDEVDLVLR